MPIIDDSNFELPSEKDFYMNAVDDTYLKMISDTIDKTDKDEQESTAAELSQQADDTMGLDVDSSDMFSSIDITGDNLSVPNMASIRTGLIAAERTEFDRSLAAGETKIYCL